ncbi:MAG: tRNA (N6-isopentenyl adenosine(37)-C2)-methylthiotransferase MiaB [Clostridiales bacterium GWF2_38_85]|nr:MAG: tRNA (N6-isopentenyl adenosine(37)-C2)-methylthiotransferase MiaB [Clostridiales bacterium GWF2_38_85]HBL85150.1 tRNA (N6-isopentenyl adenosine(37)-C2)-methylthiotransferase MiaB [Clostridiales bacterium]
MNNKYDFLSDTTQKKYIETVRKLLSANNKRPVAAIVTFGCQQNEADSEQIAGICKLMGYEVNINETDYENSELIILNTCAIREHAELKALSNTGNLKKLKENKKHLLIGMCGCMIQEKHRFEQIKKSYPYVDFMFGTDSIPKLPELLYKLMTENKRVFFVNHLPHNELGIIPENMPIIRNSTYRAWLSIMYGCNNFCTYCVVPSVRGYERSRSEQSIIDEVRQLIENGYKEITLLGQNVNSYNGENGNAFPRLLEKILDVDGDFRIRFMTSHPKDASDALIEIMNHPKMAKHFHLPFQAGSDRILKLMNRKYTKEQYLERALSIRERVKECAVSTDIICGFPTETPEEFEETLDVVNKVKFDMLYSFAYSPRKGTPAAAFEDQIPHEEKIRRFKLLTDLYDTVSHEQNLKLLGTVQRVLCDSNDIGRNSQNKIIKFTDSENRTKIGEFADIKIKEVTKYSITGNSL